MLAAKNTTDLNLDALTFQPVKMLGLMGFEISRLHVVLIKISLYMGLVLEE